ncbi:MAG: bifunctional phosphopantothenoylcysteine decarboxylase/phosphopantothenate--cysteine ligase CoaBC [Pseudomonadota bacterium]
MEVGGEEKGAGGRVLLIIGGGVAAYKSLELIRRLRDHKIDVRGILTHGGSQFITPMAVASLSENAVYTDLFSLKDESEMGHIRLSREADLVLVCPATADLIAKMAAGLANDLATTALLATNKPVMIAPSMNTRMWDHPATQRNLKQIVADGVEVIHPAAGALACGEVGTGRLAEVPDIVKAVREKLKGGAFSPMNETSASRALAGRHIVITAGPTHEPIDAVRYIANRSSGKQGFAIAGACAALGARVSLVAGPVNLETPAGVTRIDVESAREMLAATESALPADVAICVAAVADWRTSEARENKMKKDGSGPPPLDLVENPDILATLSALGSSRPALVIGFAAETDAVVSHARSKIARKGCDWIVANDVSAENGSGVMGGDINEVHIIERDRDEIESWPAMSKHDVAARLAERIVTAFAETRDRDSIVGTIRAVTTAAE